MSSKKASYNPGLSPMKGQEFDIKPTLLVLKFEHHRHTVSYVF